MKKHLLIIIVFIFIGRNATSQNPMIKLDESKKVGSTSKSHTYTMQLKGEIHTPTSDLKWKPALTKKIISSEPQEPDAELIEKIKAEKLILKSQSIGNKSENSEKSIEAFTPIVGTNYLGNLNTGFSPLDNNIAISNGGIIVSVSNDVIEYDDMSGTNLYYNPLLTFINDASITGVCDPVVHYDAGSDRFILFCQTSPLGSNSRILIFFSQTNDPNTGGWWYYNFTGDPLSNGDAFDYPKLAVSTDELFITGNLFSEPSGTFDQSVIYQINKIGGYAGGSANYVCYTGISGNPFTLLPVSYGQNGNYGPGIYLIATTSAGGSTIKLYQITNNLSNSPVLNYYSVSTTAYSVAADAQQLGTTCLLNTGNCRALSGFYLFNAGVGTIHFVFHSDIGSGWHGINYNRLNVNTQTNQSSTYGLVGSYDYCYPSVVSFATTPADNSVMIGFGRSGSTIYPEVRVVNCDNSMNWSSSTLVKASAGYVSYTSSTNERWGDYTGTTRNHSSSTPSIWMNGMFGNSSNHWDTWVAEIHVPADAGINEITKPNSLKVFPNPIAETFNVNFTLSESTNLNISIVDITGKLVKELYNGKGFEGENNFSFNKSNLTNGTYFIIIKNNKSIFKNEKIIISN